LFFLRCIIIVAVLCTTFPGISIADKVVAVVDGEKIFESEIDAFTDKVPGPFRDAFKKKALAKIIDTRVFYKLGVKDGLLDSDSYKENIARARQLIITDLFLETKLKSTIKITDKEVEAYYTQHKALFDAKKQNFDQVKEKIKLGLNQQKLKVLKQKYLDSAKVEILAKEYK